MHLTVRLTRADCTYVVAVSVAKESVGAPGIEPERWIDRERYTDRLRTHLSLSRAALPLSYTPEIFSHVCPIVSSLRIVGVH